MRLHENQMALITSDCVPFSDNFDSPDEFWQVRVFASFEQASLRTRGRLIVALPLQHMASEDFRDKRQ